MKTILLLLALNLIVISAQRLDTSVRRRCSPNRNNCPRGYVCRRSQIFCFRAPCPQARPTCQRRTCQDLRCPPSSVCRDRGSQPARCVRSIGQIGNSCPRGFVQFGSRRCFSSRQCGTSQRFFCTNGIGFAGGVCCSRRRNQSGQKPGRCPRVNRITSCDVQCFSDNQCRGRRKCCQLGCRRACVEPRGLVIAF
ncbi:hypothetical protein LOTGIDRAFT_228881 [Lottia gigantea]|uniref:WAP domain-containing protein n=1 Tax=Lottia gigantea TaxID=225164 RepID=V4A1X7_LOTGI|nr:hypothetical protein LOTGIDRAFT_228881 [Lottia gigantea]ESO88910.1 hypothetical protein LOTGIDRAFT_228881 [Lottia gigantea]